MKLDAALGGAERLAPAQAAAQSPPPPPPVSFFEFWPGWLFYTPVVLHWLALGLVHRGFTLPTAADPLIETGGLCGESKLSILDQVTGEARDLLASYTSIVAGASPDGDLAAAERAMSAAGLNYPVVAKPDIGCNGTGVRLIADAAGLADYLHAYPYGERIVLQEFLPQDGEAGLFYVRPPGAPRGRITSLTLKHAPVVVGDGRATLAQLVRADPRAGRVPHLYLPRLAARAARVPRAGERVRLVFTGNHCKGSIFEDGAPHVTDALEARMEAIARALPEFHFGRIDIRFDSIAALRRGTGFRVIEINGAGSEATHVWDPRTTLAAAWRAQFFHYGAAFRIGAANRARGFRPTGVAALFRAWRRQKRLMAAYPMND